MKHYGSALHATSIALILFTLVPGLAGADERTRDIARKIQIAAGPESVPQLDESSTLPRRFQEQLIAEVFGVESENARISIEKSDSEPGDIVSIIISDSERQLARGQLVDHKSWKVEFGNSPAQTSEFPSQTLKQERTAVAGMLIGDAGSRFIFGLTLTTEYDLGDDHGSNISLYVLGASDSSGQVITAAKEYVKALKTGTTLKRELHLSPINGLGSPTCGRGIGDTLGMASTQVACSTCTSNRTIDLYYMDVNFRSCAAGAAAKTLVAAASCVLLAPGLSKIACVAAADFIYQGEMSACWSQYHSDWLYTDTRYRQCISQCDPGGGPGHLN